VQLILLPYIFPSWQAPEGTWQPARGLLAKMDGQKFHRIAMDLATAIEQKGWGQWELLPKGQLVSGIAAICYVLIYPAPWSVLPVNALLNATGCLCMYLVMSNLAGDRQKGLIAALPFMFFPSNLLWNTQFHNENYAVPGVILIFYGWMIVAGQNKDNPPGSYMKAVWAMLLIILGSLLLGLVRVYILSGMSYLFIAAGIVLGIHWYFSGALARGFFAGMIPVVLACALMVLTVSAIEHFLPGTSDDDTAKNSTDKNSAKWKQVVWLPEPIDRQLKSLAKYRKSFVNSWTNGGSSIDLDVTFGSAGDMIAYIPRAAQIGFLSPFPSLWFSQGRNDSGTAMRIASGFEMLFVYFCLVGLPVFIWRHRVRPEVWVTVFICTAMLVVYAMIIPNVGALYRFRYPFLMPLVCFGLAAWLDFRHPERPGLETKPTP
jgi:hypothetical protein